MNLSRLSEGCTLSHSPSDIFNPTILTDEFISNICRSSYREDIWLALLSLNSQPLKTPEQMAHHASQLQKLLLATMKIRNHIAAAVIVDYAKSHNIFKKILEQEHGRSLWGVSSQQGHENNVLMELLKMACQDGNKVLFETLLEASEEIPSFTVDLLGTPSTSSSNDLSAPTFTLTESSLIFVILNLSGDNYPWAMSAFLEYAKKQYFLKDLLKAKTAEGISLPRIALQKSSPDINKLELIAQYAHLAGIPITERVSMHSTPFRRPPLEDPSPKGRNIGAQKQKWVHQQWVAESGHQGLEPALLPDSTSRKRIFPDGGREEEPRAIRLRSSSQSTSPLPPFSELIKLNSSIITPRASTSSESGNSIESSGLLTSTLPLPPFERFPSFTSNHWCSSMLQMIAGIPHLRNVYQTFATAFYVFKQEEQERQDLLHRQLQNALRAYDEAIKRKIPICSSVSKKVVEALHYFSEETFSKDPSHPENPSEVLTLILGNYQQLKYEKQKGYGPLFNMIITTGKYMPIGEPFKPDTTIDNSYQRIYRKLTFQRDMQSIIHLVLDESEKSGFLQLLENFFNPPSSNNIVSEELFRTYRHIQKFRLDSQTRRFQKPPKELLINLDRFKTAVATTSSKNNLPVSVPISLTLSSTYIVENPSLGSPSYALDAFIIHKTLERDENGRFITYRLVEEKWWECNGEAIRFVPLEEINAILHGGETTCIHHYTIIS